MAAGSGRGGAELVVERLTVAYGAHSPAVTEFSVRIPPGQTVALLGSNGAGKSTIMRALTGLLGHHRGRVVAGAIRLGDSDITRWAPVRRVRAGLAQTIEGRRIFADLSVEENLRSGALARRDRAAARADLSATYDWFPELASRRRERAGLLSGGQQQMLAMGRALMARPQLLLLDEPSLGLAPKLVERIAEIVRQIQGTGASVLLVEQNVAMSLALADRAIVLETGRVVLTGAAEELRSDPRLRAAYLGGHSQQPAGTAAE